jgi:hypothetical protein
MRAKLLGSPWWVRWLVTASVTAVIVGLFVPLGIPELVYRLTWSWRLALGAGVAASMGALWVIATQPAHRAYRAAVAGLGRADRVRALDAVRKGEIPTDPGVLTAAIRLGGIFHTRRSRRSSSIASVVVAVGLFTAAGIYLAATAVGVGDVGRAVAWIVLALIAVGLAVWDHHRGPRIAANLAALRGAADDAGLDTATQSEQSVTAITRRRVFIWIYGVGAVVLACFTAVALGVSRPSPDCRATRDIVNYLSDNRAIITAYPATSPRPSGQTVADYQRMVDQLHAYTDPASSPQVAPHLHRIGELSTQALAVVREAQRATGAPTDRAQLQRATTYTSTIQRIIDEENTLIGTCRLR